MPAITTDINVAWSVRPSVCLSVTLVLCLKGVGWNEKLLGRDTRVDPKNNALVRGSVSNRKGRLIFLIVNFTKIND